MGFRSAGVTRAGGGGDRPIAIGALLTASAEASRSGDSVDLDEAPSTAS